LAKGRRQKQREAILNDPRNAFVLDVRDSEPVTKMTKDINKLANLGSERTIYLYKQPDLIILETFVNPAIGTRNVIRHEFSEFTSLCPKTGQPDFATLKIEYVAHKLCVETKSLKLYLFAFRNEGSFMESICNRICDDLARKLQPEQISVWMKFAARGGIATSVDAHRSNNKAKKR